MEAGYWKKQQAIKSLSAAMDESAEQWFSNLVVNTLTWPGHRCD